MVAHQSAHNSTRKSCETSKKSSPISSSMSSLSCCSASFIFHVDSWTRWVGELKIGCNFCVHFSWLRFFFCSECVCALEYSCV